MVFDLYQLVLEHAPNGTYTSAGDLHEAIWTDLLRRSDPRFHNVRVTRGDGGLDGVVFQDPVTGDARVYQAKFFKDLNDEQGRHRKAIVEAFVSAHNHPFTCNSWVLLLPCQLSHGDLGWLMGTMRSESLTLALKKQNNHADIQNRIAACAIEYLDGTDLNDLLSTNLDIATKHLPNSSLSLLDALQKERESRSIDQVNFGKILRAINDEAIREHAANSRRAKAALSILNQGWSNLSESLKLALIDKKLAGNSIKTLAEHIEQHAIGRSLHAYSCEGLVPGISELVAEINFLARLLQQVSVVKEIGLADTDSEVGVAKRIIDRVQDLQRRIGEVVTRVYFQ